FSPFRGARIGYKPILGHVLANPKKFNARLRNRPSRCSRPPRSSGRTGTPGLAKRLEKEGSSGCPILKVSSATTLRDANPVKRREAECSRQPEYFARRGVHFHPRNRPRSLPQPKRRRTAWEKPTADFREVGEARIEDRGSRIEGKANPRER